VLARLYDLLTAPIERRALRRWRAILWRRLDTLLTTPSSAPDGSEAARDPRPLGLEVGVGTGANLPHYPAGGRIVAVDRSEDMLRRARSRLDEAPQGPAAVWLVQADAAVLPFRDTTFAWAAETFVFCEVDDPVAGLAEIGRVLRPHAPLLMLEHVRPRGWRGRVASLVTRVTARLWGEHLDRDAAGAVRAAGLSLTQETWLWRDVVTMIEARPGAGKR